MRPTDELTPDGASVGILMKDIQAGVVEWLWHGRKPLGMLTVVDGNPGLGKSLVTLDIAARVSSGREMPDSTPGVTGGVVLMSAEDDPGRTIRPRLEAAGADIGRVLLLTTVRQPDADDHAAAWERPLLLPGDFGELEQGIARVAAKLVIIDPLMAFLDASVDSNSDQKTRVVLTRLTHLAAQTGAAIVLVRHLNKAVGGHPLYRGGGSIAIIGAARSGLLVERDPEDEERRVLAPLKSNLGPRVPSLAFSVRSAESGVPIVEWLGQCSYTADQLLVPPQTHGGGGSALSEACQFLQAALAIGARPQREIEREAGDADISTTTLRRAAKKLGVKSSKEGYGPGSGWTWELASVLDRPLPSQELDEDARTSSKVTTPTA